VKKKKKKPAAAYTTMPCPSKKAAQALAQRQAGQGVFSTAPPTIFDSDRCSAYNSSDGQTDEDFSDRRILIPNQ